MTETLEVTKQQTLKEVLTEIGGHPPITESQSEAEKLYTFFSAIDEDLWATGTYHLMGRSCALGHLYINKYGHKYGPALPGYCAKMTELYSTFNWVPEFIREKFQTQGYYNLPDINDGSCPCYVQPSPKQRILAMLSDAIEAGY